MRCLNLPWSMCVTYPRLRIWSSLSGRFKPSGTYVSSRECVSSTLVSSGLLMPSMSIMFGSTSPAPPSMSSKTPCNISYSRFSPISNL